MPDAELKTVRICRTLIYELVAPLDATLQDIVDFECLDTSPYPPTEEYWGIREVSR